MRVAAEVPAKPTQGLFRVYGSGGSGVLARLLAADQDRHAAQIDEDLRRRCAVVFAVIVAPNISTYQLADASGSLLMM